MKEKIVVTIFTPTYNRLSTLPKLLESLCHQTNNSFQWVIIDDGSTDDTEKFFDDLKKQELPFEWEYHRKQNGGKHTALNACHTYIRGEVVLILDSDDYLTFDAVETIQSEWKNYKNKTIKLNLGQTIYVKGIDKNGVETSQNSLISTLPSDAIGLNAYDEDNNTYFQTSSLKYIYVDNSMYDKYIRLKGGATFYDAIF